jgi:Secretion system C-terminal sorting domain
VLGANCLCAGTPVSGCDNWTLEITTDNVGSETTWEIRNATTLAVVDAGGPYASNTTTTETVCLPPAACYQLIVTDANGMSNGTVGGYVMRDPSGKRVLDNANDGVFTGISQAVRPFCSPVGDLTIWPATIDKTWWLPTDYVNATADPAVAAQYGIGDQTDDGYEFWFFNPDGGYDRQIYISNANPVTGAQPGPNAATYLRLNQITNPPPSNVLLNLRVRSRVNGVQAGWGSVSRFKIDPVAAQCPTAQLVPYAGSQFSCGATKTAGATGSNGQIVSTAVTKVVNGNNVNANRFWFAFTEPNTGYVRNAWTTTRTLVLSKWTTAPLLCGTHTYDVVVRASFDGGTTWCPAGSTCTVTITNNFAAPFCTPVGSAFAWAEDRIFTDGDEPVEATLTMWPNPNRGEELNLTIDALNSDVTTATLDMYDMYGKKVMARSIAVNGSSLTAVVRMENGMAAGIYVVNVTAGDQTFTQRLVIQ